MKRSGFLKYLGLGLGAVLVVSACNSGTNTNQANPAPATTETPAASPGKPFKVATEPAFTPFESKVGNELVGFDIDLMNAIGKAAGLTVEFQSLPFDGIIPALQANTVDAAISAITITPERQTTVSFSHPYFKAGLAIAVRKDNTDITALNSLQNRKIAVQIGTTGAAKAKSIAGAKVSSFDSAPLALQELINGNVDAVVNDAPVTLDAIERGNLQSIKVVGELLTEEFYGIALPKDSPHLNAVNTALNKMIADGTYTQIYRKWFGTEPPKLPDTVPAATSSP